ncbi:metal-binding protein [Parenemella sanctibonifatiensis]|uniref:Metal-binding protein n=2 Tax=Parenemella sanctibonifatiensis TaxID=2016505 RepID=A0A255EJ93_9ACTN|nr:metal-binding protein [Parenemella sanctibonifatiensis]
MRRTAMKIDRRSELVLDIHELRREAGATKEIQETVAAPAEIGSPIIGVPEGAPIALDVTLQSVGEGVLVTGDASMPLTGECSRCLTAVSDTIEVDLQELYVYEESEASEEEAGRVIDDCIDLEPLIRDLVVLDLPFIPLCRPDCAGLCPECGVNLNEHPDHAHEAPIDARWAQLAGWQGESDAEHESDAGQDSETEQGQGPEAGR